MVKVEIQSFLFICSKISVSQCEKFVLAKFNSGNKLKEFSAMLVKRKGNSYVVPVWSDNTVLEMVFVESTSFIWPMIVVFWLKPLTEWDYRVVSHDFKNVYNYTPQCCLTPTTPQGSEFARFAFPRRV